MEGEGLGVRKGAWSANEDLLLTRYIHEHGEGNWHLIPKRAGLNRCRKSCRLRWLNYLSPDIKRGSFANDEIDLIIRLHKLLGNRWSLIAGRIPGRTANDVKNFWNIHIKKTQKLNYSNKKTDNLSKMETPDKVEIIRPRARTFSKNIFFLKEKTAMIETEDNISHNNRNKTKEITYQNQSKTTLLEHEQGNQSFLCCLKSPYMDVNIPSKDISQEQGDNYWQQHLYTSHSFVPLPIHEQQTLPQLNTDWSDLFWENMDICSLLRDEDVMF